jgi:hypothetical protein
MQNALSASAGRAFFHGRVSRNLVVILFAYVVVTGQLPMNLMRIASKILYGINSPVKSSKTVKFAAR